MWLTNLELPAMVTMPETSQSLNAPISSNISGVTVQNECGFREERVKEPILCNVSPKNALPRLQDSLMHEPESADGNNHNILHNELKEAEEGFENSAYDLLLCACLIATGQGYLVSFLVVHSQH